MSTRGIGRALVWGAPVVLVVMAVLALLWAVPRARDARAESGGWGAESAAGDSAVDGTVDTAPVDERVIEAAREAGEAEALPSSAGSFLSDLDDPARRASAGAVDAVSWTERAGLMDAASDVLERYRALPTASLVTAGYLDLHGNAWGALLTDGASWVDVVTVSAGESDEVSEVRVARMRPDEGDG